MRITKVLGLALGLFVASLCGGAAAQGARFGSSGDFALGGERMFGFLSSSFTSEEGDAEDTYSVTEFTFLAAGGSSPYASPRLAFDAFVIDGLSVGGILGIGTVSTENEVSGAGGSVSSDGPSSFAVLFGARAGYALMFSDSVGVWPHLGFTYYTLSTESDDGNDETSSNGLAVALDAMLVATLAPHFGLTIGPVLDLGVSGGTEVTTSNAVVNTTVETDATVTDFGLQAGLVGWL